MHVLEALFKYPIDVSNNYINIQRNSTDKQANQDQTQQIFGNKWEDVLQESNSDTFYQFQFEWFLKLYGFEHEDSFKTFLRDKNTIIDTGCGLGYKAAWFAKLAPHATVLGVDLSNAAFLAAKQFRHVPNLYFFQGDISDTGLRENSIDFTVCDQVIMHTEVPENTFAHLSDITKPGGAFACYVYRKKALPRELIDDYFRSATHQIPADQMWAFSAQLTELGKRLSELNVSFESPDIPLLGIKGGTYDIQRFIYWNFLKCFWKEDWGFDLSKSTNFDWYAPSNAKRFSEAEFRKMINDNNLHIDYFHDEEACYSGRFTK